MHMQLYIVIKLQDSLSAFEKVNCLMYFACVMVQIGTISILGSQAAMESGTINVSIYNLKWYSYSKLNKKIILLFLMETQREIQFNGLNFFILSNATFLRVSMS